MVGCTAFPHGLKHLATGAKALAANRQAFAGLIQDGFSQGDEVLLDVGPPERVAGLIQPFGVFAKSPRAYAGSRAVLAN
jgi:hypothetical protein